MQQFNNIVGYFTHKLALLGQHMYTNATPWAKENFQNLLSGVCIVHYKSNEYLDRRVRNML